MAFFAAALPPGHPTESFKKSWMGDVEASLLP